MLSTSNIRQNPDCSQAAHRLLTGHVCMLSRHLLLVQVLMVYIQWAMLIINMPITWLPWVVHSSESAAGETDCQQQAMTNSSATTGFNSFVDGVMGVLFGRSATLDCFLQAGLAVGYSTIPCRQWAGTSS